MQIPDLGKEYYFFDDGKISPSRCYKAKVTGIYPYKEKINVKVFDYDLNEYKEILIQEIHKKEVDEHRQRENFKVLSADLVTVHLGYMQRKPTISSNVKSKDMTKMTSGLQERFMMIGFLWM